MLRIKGSLRYGPEPSPWECPCPSCQSRRPAEPQKAQSSAQLVIRADGLGEFVLSDGERTSASRSMVSCASLGMKTCSSGSASADLPLMNSTGHLGIFQCKAKSAHSIVWRERNAITDAFRTIVCSPYLACHVSLHDCAPSRREHVQAISIFVMERNPSGIASIRGPSYPHCA